jgi:enamine deaminase RidA (YjgF/YER057c/UK114 family)
MPRFLNPATAPQALGRYSQAVVLGAAYKRAIIAGQFGLLPDGTLCDGLEAQMEQAFDNFLAMVAAADMTILEVVRIAAYVTRPGSIGLFRLVWDRKIGKAKPAATYAEVAGFINPNYLVQIEGEAWREQPLADKSFWINALEIY